jgi:16S rRNA (cytosine1402-N4)-methyltransferase
MTVEKPTRRPRYKGKNPRHFAEKYKEHSPERYADEIAKVIASGRTPAGMHRPVMVDEIVDVLGPKAGELAVDCTLGYGGHAAVLLRAIQPAGRLIGIDVDPVELPKTESRLRALGYDSDIFTALRGNYAGLARLLEQPADIILADLGLSSMQIDDPARGFTFKFDGPLDLRMNPRRGRPAHEFLALLSEGELAGLLKDNADEPNAQRLAAAILRALPRTTTGLAGAVRDCGGDDDTIRRVFQALRIAVNDEFRALEAFLRDLPFCLREEGRVAILTFHSGEDRRVKKAFQAGERVGLYSAAARDVIRAGPEERRGNPRSRSAKLRWARRSALDIGSIE